MFSVHLDRPSIRPLLLLVGFLVPAAVRIGGFQTARAQPSDTTAQHPSTDDLTVRWPVDTNLIDGGSRFQSTLTLQNQGDVSLKGSGWTLYFNFLREIDPETVEAPVRLTRINGDFYELKPGDGFSTLPPGEELRISFEAPGSTIKHTDAPAGFYVVFSNEQGTPEPPAIVSDVTMVPFTRSQQMKRGPNDAWSVPTPTSRYRDNQTLNTPPADSVGRIVPSPVSTERRSGSFTLSADATIHYEEGLASEARLLAAGLAPVLGRRPQRRRLRLTRPFASDGPT